MPIVILSTVTTRFLIFIDQKVCSSPRALKSIFLCHTLSQFLICSGPKQWSLANALKRAVKWLIGFQGLWNNFSRVLEMIFYVLILALKRPSSHWHFIFSVIRITHYGSSEEHQISVSKLPNDSETSSLYFYLLANRGMQLFFLSPCNTKTSSAVTRKKKCIWSFKIIYNNLKININITFHIVNLTRW